MSSYAVALCAIALCVLGCGPNSLVQYNCAVRSPVRITFVIDGAGPHRQISWSLQNAGTIPVWIARKWCFDGYPLVDQPVDFVLPDQTLVLLWGDFAMPPSRGQIVECKFRASFVELTPGQIVRGEVPLSSPFTPQHEILNPFEVSSKDLFTDSSSGVPTIDSATASNLYSSTGSTIH